MNFFKGKPEPQVRWRRNGEDIRETQRVNTEVRDECTIFNIKECQRSDAGSYEIALSNSAGTESVFVKVGSFMPRLSIDCCFSSEPFTNLKLSLHRSLSLTVRAHHADQSNSATSHLIR